MIDPLMVPWSPSSRQLFDCSELHIAHGTFVNFHHFHFLLISYLLTNLDVTGVTSSELLIPILFFDVYIVCYIFAIELTFFGILILLSDASAIFVFNFNIFLRSILFRHTSLYLGAYNCFLWFIP